MKQQILFLIFFFTLPIATAVVIPHYITIVTGCASNITLIVDGSLPINSGEYNMRNCNSTGVNTWDCKCGYPLYITTQPNTINNYTFTLTYLTKKSINNTGGNGKIGYPANETLYYYYILNRTINQSNTTIHYPINLTNITIINQINITPPGIESNRTINIYENTTAQANKTTPVKPTPVVVHDWIAEVWNQFWAWLMAILNTKLW